MFVENIENYMENYMENSLYKITIKEIDIFSMMEIAIL